MAEILSIRRQYHQQQHPHHQKTPQQLQTDMKSYITTSTGSLSTLTATVHDQRTNEGHSNANTKINKTKRRATTKKAGDNQKDEEVVRNAAANVNIKDDNDGDAESVCSEVSHYDEYMKGKPSMSKANSRIVKLKKINDLQRANRVLRDENATMRQEMREMKTKMKQMEKALQRTQKKSTTASGGEDKMMDAIQALRSVTLKQEKKLRALKKERKDNNAEIADRDELIDSIQKERDAFKSAYEHAKEECVSNQTEIKDLQRDLASSIELVEELEEKLNQEHERAQIASAELKEATAHIQTLEHRLEASKSTTSLQSTRQSMTTDTPGETELSQIAKLQRELSTKIEHIVLLEFELEVAREELQELRDSRTMDQVFPALNAVEEEFSEEEFSDDDFEHLHEENDNLENDRFAAVPRKKS